jgi:ABC-type enterochelin transport system permease subunit
VARQALDNILCAINLILWIAIAGLFLWIMLENKFRSPSAVRSARSCEYILLFCCFIWRRHSSLAEEETFGLALRRISAEARGTELPHLRRD